jgi:hydantoinase/carbamoylase family amidase
MTVAYKIAKSRLLNTIHDTAERFGASGIWGKNQSETGVCRLALTDLDKGVRDWFVQETKAIGCEVKIDQLGNIFAVYPGQNTGAPTAIGSHLDTQPTGGRYDGIYGVLCGLELLRTLKDNNIVPQYPIAVVDWTNEEGARFPKSVMSLSVWAGLADLQETYALESIIDTDNVVSGEKNIIVEPSNGRSVRDELRRIGYLGEIDCSHIANPLAAHFEIHIEQGPVLEDENKKIGIVLGGQAYSWVQVRVRGKAQHTGTTPLQHRSDALLVASQMMVRGNEIAAKHNGLFSVGRLSLEPDVVNVIPEEVVFTLDTRHVSDAKLKEIVTEVHQQFAKIAADAPGRRCLVEFEHIHTADAVKFAPECIECVLQSAVELFGAENVREIVSGAGHDSCAVNGVVPTAMIFIPSREGVSHNPAEYSLPEQVEDGFRVLMEAVLKWDSRRTK